jgi:hypothetical protein
MRMRFVHFDELFDIVERHHVNAARVRMLNETARLAWICVDDVVGWY